MPFIVPVLAEIGSVIWGAITAVTAVVAATVASVLATVIAILGPIAAGIASAVTATMSAILWVGITAWSGIEAVASYLAYQATQAFFWVSWYAEEIWVTMGEILNAIHFKTIIAVNNIAMLVSSDYRNMMKQVYGALGEASQALGYTTEFLALAINNARTLVLDVSTTFGSKYDLAQVTWLSQFSHFMERVQNWAYIYEKNPEQLFFDLAEYIERPAANIKGSFMQSVLITMEKTGVIISEYGEKFQTIITDANRLIMDLPSIIGKNIAPHIKALDGQFKSFMSNEFVPAYNRFNENISALNRSMSATQANVQNVVDNMLVKTEIGTGLSRATTAQKEIAWDALNAIQNQRQSEAALAIFQAYAPVRKTYDELEKHVFPSTPPPPFLSYEAPTIEPPTESPVTPAKSWFVGDF